MQKKPVTFSIAIAEDTTLESLAKQAAEGTDILVIMGAGSIRALADGWRV